MVPGTPREKVCGRPPLVSTTLQEENSGKLYLDLSLLLPSVSCQGLPLAKPNRKLSTGSPSMKPIQAILWGQSRVVKPGKAVGGASGGWIQRESAPNYPGTWPGLPRSILPWMTRTVFQRLTLDPGWEGALGSFRPRGE